MTRSPFLVFIMNMELDHGLFKSPSFDLNTGEHISVGNCPEYGVPE